MYILSELFGDCAQVKIVETFAENHDDVVIFYPRHPNPNVTRALEKSGIKSTDSIFISNPICYTDLVYLLLSSDFVATDSGGIQEEAVSLGRHVLCLRDHTERQEGVWEGLERLVGTDESAIMDGLEHFHKQSTHPLSSSVYGDGKACMRIVSILKEKLSIYSSVSKNKNISVKRSNGVNVVL